MPPTEPGRSADLTAQSVMAWLASPPADDVDLDIDRFRGHVRAVAEHDLPPALRQRLTAQLQERGNAIVEQAFGNMRRTRLPLSGRVRTLIRRLQDALETLANLYIEETRSGERMIKGLQRPPEIALWHALNNLRRHILLSNLAAAPHGADIWRMAHEIRAQAVNAGLSSLPANEAGDTIERLYIHILLLGCPHPATFTSGEWLFIDAFVAQNGRNATIVTQMPDSDSGMFWAASGSDMPPLAFSRKPPPARDRVIVLDTRAFGSHLAGQIESGDETIRRQLARMAPDLPLSAALGTLQRLREILAETRKRRFSRRRQGYRARICFRLDAVWQLLKGQRDDDTLGEWQVVNESPDGYATMHVTGKTQKLQVGDLAAIRRYHDEDWQICIIRWAHSENPEHFELGLQALAPSATSGLLALPGPLEINKQPVLLMAPVAGQRNSTLAVPSGLALDLQSSHVIITESGNIGVLEVRLDRLVESTAGTDLYGVAES